MKTIMAPVIDLPPAETLRPDQAIGELGKHAGATCHGSDRIGDCQPPAL